MSAERRCVDGTPADYLCLYHKVPMCPQCRFTEQHASCPNVPLGITDTFPERGTERGNCYERCIENYDSARDLRIKCSDLQKKSPAHQRESLDTLFKEFKSKVTILQEDTEKCSDESKTNCQRKCTAIQSVSDDVMKEVGKHMKELFENTQDVSQIDSATKEYKKVLDSRRKELYTYDLDSLLTAKLARLFDPDRIVTFQQAIVNSQLIDSIYPPEVRPNLNLVLRMDARVCSENWADISGCTVLRGGVLALVDRQNSSIKLFTTDGSFIKSISVGSSPFDITENDHGFCVSHPKSKQIIIITTASGYTEEKRKTIGTRDRCFGLEYGGQRLVVSCHLSGYLHQTWQFCVYGNNDKLLQVIEKDRMGKSFCMSQGYFSFCPFRDQIMFLTTDAEVKQFHITRPSRLSDLGPLGSKDGEVITALASCGSTIITCHTEPSLLPYWPGTSTLRLQSSIPTATSDADFNSRYPGPMCCDVRSKVLVVCKRYQRFTDNEKTVFVYNF